MSTSRRGGIAAVAAALLATACALPWLGDSEADRFLGMLLGLRELPAVERTPIRWRIDGRAGEGDLYRGAGAGRDGLVLVPGLAPAGRDDPRLVHFARVHAAAGFTVLVPEVPGFRRYAVGPEAVDAIAAAARHLASRLGAPVGVGAISFAAGPALIAAAREPAAASIAYLLTIGGYHDLRALVRFHTAPGPGAGTAPDPAGRWLIALAVAEAIDDPAEAEALRTRAAAGLLGHADAGRDPATGSLGRAVLRLLENEDPGRVDALLDALPPRIGTALRAVDPSAHDLGGLRAEVLLVHGRGDRVIPWTQSAGLARRLPPGRARLFLLEGLAHVELEPAPADLPAIREAVDALLARRRAH